MAEPGKHRPKQGQAQPGQFDVAEDMRARRLRLNQCDFQWTFFPPNGKKIIFTKRISSTYKRISSTYKDYTIFGHTASYFLSILQMYVIKDF